MKYVTDPNAGHGTNMATFGQNVLQHLYENLDGTGITKENPLKAPGDKS